MTDLEKAARMALEALEYYQHRKIEWDYSDDAAITALRQALEQPAKQQEVVAYLVYDFGAESQYLAFDEELGDMDGCKVTPLYEHPPASKPWVGLTDEQIVQLSLEWPAETNDWASHIDFARAIEAKLKEKNA